MHLITTNFTCIRSVESTGKSLPKLWNTWLFFMLDTSSRELGAACPFPSHPLCLLRGKWQPPIGWMQVIISYSCLGAISTTADLRSQVLCASTRALLWPEMVSCYSIGDIPRVQGPSFMTVKQWQSHQGQVGDRGIWLCCSSPSPPLWALPLQLCCWGPTSHAPLFTTAPAFLLPATLFLCSLPWKRPLPLRSAKASLSAPFSVVQTPGSILS